MSAPIAAPNAAPDAELTALVRATALTDPAGAMLVDFVEALYARLPTEERALRPAADWLALAREFLDFAIERQVGLPKLRLFNPGTGGHSVLQVVNDDMPFLVDSISMALAEQGIGTHLLVHPVVRLRRESGRLLAIGAGAAESLMHVEIDRQPAEELPALQARLEAALADVRACVQDWSAMREVMVRAAAELSSRPLPVNNVVRAEAQDFLNWAADNHFTFLGYREYRVSGEGDARMLVPVEGSGLGLMRHAPSYGPRPLGEVMAQRRSGERDVLILTKTNARATVHRPGYMDYIGVLVYDADGNAVAEQRFLGLYTSGAYNRRPWEIPLVRRRHDQIMERSGLAPGSHSGKALRHILDTLPRDELFQASTDELSTTAMGILALHERPRSRLFLRRDRYGRFFTALVYIPRDRFSGEVRSRIETLLREALQGGRLDSSIHIGSSPLAQMYLVVRPLAGTRVDADPVQLEQRIAAIVRNWYDGLREALVRLRGEGEGLRLARRFAKGLPPGYMDAVPPEAAAVDLVQADQLASETDLKLSLYEDAEGLRFKAIRLDRAIALSDALPMLENLGLRILSEHPYELDGGGRTIAIQDFVVQAQCPLDDLASAQRHFEDAFARVWRGEAENDGFNRLVLVAGIDWRQVAMLRGYAKYLLQTGVPFSQAYMEETLVRYPQVAQLLVELFEARFDPRREHSPEARAVAIAGLDEAIGQALEQVSSLDEDRILRSLKAVIQATLRTSFFQNKGRDFISFKFDPAKVPDLPKPKPYREIFVYSPSVEGVHLRFGPVARGGLRWSDRREDFRTEVLGLVKAQMVKNTVIVPVGSKGGFFPKRLPPSSEREAWLAEGIASYKRFINGLLDITDNIVEGTIVPPVDVVRHDADDPYLVVAADKGTATFSDIANSISAEHGFWLGDAFASGGSVGYDHKGMGITARGGWESVKRHFRALGRDCQNEDFTVVGVGDMSGDVFGNGMLLSKHIRLLAAFDHRHIFLDPNPDAAISFAERERLFKLPRSSWDDYDKTLISTGGSVYPRSAKHIPVSAEVRAALGIDEAIEQMTPAALMNAILKAPVDLLWNGGIGTYVKASSEAHADAGDRANNGLRVDGRDLRCKVVGEGGNLGMTQKGRIEAALNGVLLNTDFIDNSAGVDTSDHEVNIKILLGAVMARGGLTLDQRNALLAEMTEEVGALVLNDNYRQNQAISLMERMSVPRLGSFQHLIRTLESQGLLDRAIEFLPTDAEFSERRSRGLGLTRPELSILLSYDKIVIFNQLLDSDVPEDPYLSRELQRYFPKPLQERYAADMEGHRLRREIIATAVTNSMVNRMGSTFVLRMQEDTGETPAAIAKAYTVAREILNARDWWSAIDAADLKVPEAAQIDALMAIWHLLRQYTRWLLNRPGEELQIAAMVARYADALGELRQGLPSVLPVEARAHFTASAETWARKGFDEALAADFASLPFLAYGPDIAAIALQRGLPVGKVAAVYFLLSETLHSKWLMDQVEQLPVDGRWHAQARSALRDELQQQQSVLVGQVLGGLGARQAAAEAVAAWLASRGQGLRHTLAMFADMRTLRNMDYATLLVAVRRLGQIAVAGEPTVAG
ncbi:NAD-glutamate dehydrogenase [Silanimonas sp.]|uniref:NAD-glutamate dehydrogenase n=1 Tax=Silanimonas sp. TaxID=1929290 RepID=UPI001BBF6FF2|nr:NAD-glutamate dehydrogenase [Silanimonas sp.]MBS3896668.1 NAD-glutamate dehydrogenase [Silanimonas sp.]MBS3924536.1 NAD-glutamate dehydrogenase [Xanthomonadaceae bacterium]